MVATDDSRKTKQRKEGFQTFIDRAGLRPCMGAGTEMVYGEN